MCQMTIRETSATPVVSIRERLEPSQLPSFMDRVFGELYAAVPRLGLQPAGHPFTIYHAVGRDAIDAEVCAPVDRLPSQPLGELTLTARLVPGDRVATTIHVGPYDGLGEAYDAIERWVADSGHEQVGPMRERYLDGPDETPDPIRYRTEIEIPVARVPVLA